MRKLIQAALARLRTRSLPLRGLVPLPRSVHSRRRAAFGKKRLPKNKKSMCPSRGHCFRRRIFRTPSRGHCFRRRIFRRGEDGVRSLSGYRFLSQDFVCGKKGHFFVGKRHYSSSSRTTRDIIILHGPRDSCWAGDMILHGPREQEHQCRTSFSTSFCDL